MLHSLVITVPGCMSCMSNKPTIVLHAVPLPPHTLHLSSLAEEPSIMSQPTGYKTYTLQPYAIKKKPLSHLTLSFDANIDRFIVTSSTINYLLFMPIIETFSSRHTVEFARIWTFGIWDPSDNI